MSARVYTVAAPGQPPTYTPPRRACGDQVRQSGPLWANGEPVCTCQRRAGWVCPPCRALTARLWVSAWSVALAVAVVFGLHQWNEARHIAADVRADHAVIIANRGGAL